MRINNHNAIIFSVNSDRQIYQILHKEMFIWYSQSDDYILASSSWHQFESIVNDQKAI